MRSLFLILPLMISACAGDDPSRLSTAPPGVNVAQAALAAKTFALVFYKGDEYIGELTDFAKQQSLEGSHLTAIGAFKKATLGYFDREKKDYKKIPINEQVEVLSLIGDIAMKAENGEPKIHAHVVVGKSDGTAHGGHILEAFVWPTLEVIITENPKHLQRKSDPETGLALISL